MKNVQEIFYRNYKKCVTMSSRMFLRYVQTLFYLIICVKVFQVDRNGFIAFRFLLYSFNCVWIVVTNFSKNNKCHENMVYCMQYSFVLQEKGYNWTNYLKIFGRLKLILLRIAQLQGSTIWKNVMHYCCLQKPNL